MSLISRYLLKNLLYSSGFASLILVGIVWMTQSLKLMDFWMNRGISFQIFLKFIFLALPDLVVLTLPIGMLLGITFVFSRLLNDHELVTMRSLGLSDISIARPVLALATGVFLTLNVLSLYVSPQSFKSFRSLESELRSTIRASMIIPGDFNTFKGITVFARSRDRSGRLKGIMIHRAQKDKKTFTVLAREGTILEDEKGALISLKDGYRQEVDLENKQPVLVSFERYVVRISGETPEAVQKLMKPYEMSLHELFFLMNQNSPYDTMKLQSEVHQRLIMPFISFIFALIAVLFFLKQTLDRRQRSKTVLKIFGTCFLAEVAIWGLLQLGSKNALYIFCAYIIVLGLIVISAYLLWRQKGDKVPSPGFLRHSKKPGVY